MKSKVIGYMMMQSRMRKGLSQTKMGKVLGLNQGAMTSMEVGKRSIPFELITEFYEPAIAKFYLVEKLIQLGLVVGQNDLEFSSPSITISARDANIYNGIRHELLKILNSEAGVKLVKAKKLRQLQW